MFRIEKTIKVSSMHNLNLDYESPCSNQHGHNYTIKVGLIGSKVNHNGMLLDFSHIKKIVNVFDHDNLNNIMTVNPTAENMCEYLANKINLILEGQNHLDNIDTKVEYVKVWETDDSWAEWREN